MYQVIGSDGKEYGPATAEQIRAWVTQGRLNAKSRLKADGSSDWKLLGEIPEFTDLIGAPKAPPPIALAPQVSTQKLSALAISSLILGVLGLFTLGLAAIPGLVLGIVALVKIQKNQTQLKGSGLAIAGICVSGVMLIFLPLMAAMLLPALARAKQRAQAIQCMNNVKQVDLALVMYARDHGDRLPPADHWNDLLKPYTGGSNKIFHCPAQPPGRCSYALNAQLAGEKLPDSDVANVVLVFSSTEGWNQAGDPRDAVVHNHGRGTIVVGYADGHTAITRLDRLKPAP